MSAAAASSKRKAPASEPEKNQKQKTDVSDTPSEKHPETTPDPTLEASGLTAADAVKAARDASRTDFPTCGGFIEKTLETVLRYINKLARAGKTHAVFDFTSLDTSEGAEEPGKLGSGLEDEHTDADDETEEYMNLFIKTGTSHDVFARVSCDLQSRSSEGVAQFEVEMTDLSGKFVVNWK